MWLKKFYYRHKVAARYGLSLLLLTIFFYSLTRLSCFYYLTKVYGEDKEYFPDDICFIMGKYLYLYIFITMEFINYE
jgi:hypothetical protein